MSTSIIIVGTGGHARAVTETAISAGFTVTGYLDDTSKHEQFLGAPIITPKRHHIPSRQAFAIAIGHNFARQKVLSDLISKFEDIQFPAIIHQSCVVGFDVDIGDGSIAMPNSYIGPCSKVGEFCIVNSSASVDHDCNLRDFSSVAPGATLGGKVTLGERAAIGIGANLKHGIAIGSDTVIGGNSFVNCDIDNNVVAFGSPAKVRRQRDFASEYL